jgi:hypothetical protein
MEQLSLLLQLLLLLKLLLHSRRVEAADEGRVQLLLRVEKVLGQLQLRRKKPSFKKCC